MLSLSLLPAFKATALCSTMILPNRIISFSDKASRFHGVNCEVVGVLWTPLHPPGVDLLRRLEVWAHPSSQTCQQISRDYGVLLEELKHPY
ncbi:thioredoxin-dependent peroxide reductase, mitochondrial [Lates japonicus]|uniref:Thioredoxin-dependent peroxide reductase, mitochondrial n=1 Tax=Lates japonicus TaxID=270547 RepID=A0AAD3MM74_LATJO|nr:thioredoxin-dependent peroxide reductase, mitochondrial [Lates japonicus]